MADEKPSPPDGGLADAGKHADACFDNTAVDGHVGACEVTPIISVVTAVVLVKKPYTSQPMRQPVHLTTDQAFDGTGTFAVTTGGGKIRFFTAASDGAEVQSGQSFPGADLSSGITIYAQGEIPSDAEKDVTLQLSLMGGSKPVKGPATDKMTSVEVTLDICKSRTKPGTDPEPLSAADKIGLGRYLHFQDAGRRHRAMLIVRKARPETFTGRLLLTAMNGQVRCFDVEGPGAEAGTDRETIPNPAIPADGLKLWAQGAGLSGALHDTGFRLGVDKVDLDGDRVIATVFEINKIEATLRATPCKRDGTRANVMPAKSSVADSKTFDATAITVVRACGDLKLTATATPADTPVSWDVERASDDDKRLKGKPTHSADGSDKKRLLKTDAAGSFHVQAFVDCNGDGKRGDDEDGLILNVTMVNIEILPGVAHNRIITRNSRFHSVADPAQLIVQSGSDLAVSQGINGSYGPAQMILRPLVMSVRVKLTGGGHDLRRGVDRVFLGYIHNFRGDSFMGTYADGRTEKEVFDSSPPPPVMITTGPGAVALLAFPIRDTRSASQNGTAPFIINSTDADPAYRKDLPSGGQLRAVKFMDKPSVFVDKVHAESGSALDSISGSNDFVAFLVAFSSDFDENYTVFAKGDWSITFGTYSAAAGWTRAGARATAAKAMDTAGMPITGESAGMERCTPNAVDNWKLDAR
jgi:hypothetical protein